MMQKGTNTHKYLQPSQDVHKCNTHTCTYTEITMSKCASINTAYMRAHTENYTNARAHTHTHVQVNMLMRTLSLIHIFCLSNEINHWGNLICKSRRKSALKPQKESSFRRRLMVGMMELMEHCMPREKKSDLQLYIETYSLFLKQSTDSLTYCFLLPKTFWCKRFLHFHFCLLFASV